MLKKEIYHSQTGRFSITIFFMKDNKSNLKFIAAYFISIAFICDSGLDLNLGKMRFPGSLISVFGLIFTKWAWERKNYWKKYGKHENSEI